MTGIELDAILMKLLKFTFVALMVTVFSSPFFANITLLGSWVFILSVLIYNFKDIKSYYVSNVEEKQRGETRPQRYQNYIDELNENGLELGVIKFIEEYQILKPSSLINGIELREWLIK